MKRCKETIPMFKVAMNPEVNHLLLKTIHSGWIGQGNMVKTFENRLSDVFDNKNVLALSAGTHGLTLALRMCDVHAGDEVITTPLTCLSYLSSIETDKGFLPIGKIVNQKINTRVKSINEKTGKIEWKRITNWIKLSSENVEWYMIYLKDGNSSRSKIAGKRHLWITGDHKILTFDGYKRVDELNDIELIATDYKTPNDKQIQFINGTMLGDGHIQKCRNSARLTFCHCGKQKEWIKFKEKALNGFNIYRNSKENKEIIQTEINLPFKKLRKKWYAKNNNSKDSKIVPDIELTPLTLATWYMDDGSLSNENVIIISTEGFNSNYFWMLFYKLVDLGLKPTAHKKGKGYRIYIGNGLYDKHNSAKRFFEIISPYIIPSMRYKLPNDIELDDFNPKLWDLGKAETYYSRVITKKGNPPKYHKPKYVYCLEVEDNHNFISKNMVLSNCTATNMPILQQGADIVWADVGKDFNIDPKSIKSCITNKTKAIMVVHWGGYPCDMNEIALIAHEAGDIPIIEDCAHAYGSTYKNHKIGDCFYSDFAMFSFQAIKHLTSIDGGALCTKEKWSHDRGKLLRWYGIDREGKRTDFRCEEDIKHWGYKFHMNDICAVVGMENMEIAQENVYASMNNAKYFEKELSGLNGIEITQIADDRESSNWLFTMLVENRSEFCHMMGSKGISVSRVHERNDKHTCFKRFQRELPCLESIIDKMICIPVGWWLKSEDKEYIVESIKEGW